MQQLTSSQSAPEVPLNENFETLGHQAVYGKRQPATSGLTWGYYGGRWGGFPVIDGTFTLDPSDITYIVVDKSDGTTSADTDDTDWLDTANFARVYALTTSASAVTAVEDHRAGPAGAHGGGAGGVGAGLTDGDKGDFVVSSSGAAWAIDSDVVSYAKMQNVSATKRVLGRDTAGAGDPEEVTLSQLLDWIGSAARGDFLFRGSSAWARLVSGTLGKVLTTRSSSADPTWEFPLQVIPIACSDENTTALTTGTGKVTFMNPFDTVFNVVAVKGQLVTPQGSGSIFTVDINEAGTTILSTKLTIDNTENLSTTAATPAVISDASIAANAVCSIDIDQVGDGTAKGLKVYLIGWVSPP